MLEVAVSQTPALSGHFGSRLPAFCSRPQPPTRPPRPGSAPTPGRRPGPPRSAPRLGSAPGGRRRRRASGVRPDDVAGRSGSGVTGRRWRRGAGRLRGGACCVRGDAEARDGGARAAALRGRRAAPPPVPAAACPRRRARAHGEAGPGLPRRRSGGSPGLPAPGPCCRRGAAAPAAARRARPGGERRAAAWGGGAVGGGRRRSPFPSRGFLLIFAAARVVLGVRAGLLRDRGPFSPVGCERDARGRAAGVVCSGRDLPALAVSVAAVWPGAVALS